MPQHMPSVHSRVTPDEGARPIPSNRTSLTFLITAGPTHEPIDRVRYIANRSSGRMGIAIAEAVAARGHRATLLLGPTHLHPHPHALLEVVRFRTTEDLEKLLAERWPEHDVLIMAAAVADYRPTAPSAGKFRRTDTRLSLELEPTPDLLARLPRRPGQTVVGFALEPADALERSALAKLTAKRLDLVVANPLETIDDESVTAVLFGPSGAREAAPTMTKLAFAEWLLDRIARIASR